MLRLRIRLAVLVLLIVNAAAARAQDVTFHTDATHTGHRIPESLLLTWLAAGVPTVFTRPLAGYVAAGHERQHHRPRRGALPASNA